MIHKYIGRERFQDWLHDVSQVKGGTVSPGGVCMMLGITRSSVSELISRGRLDAWNFLEKEDGRAVYIEVGCLSVERFAKENNREVLCFHSRELAGR